jgi:uncharacterized hydrophobic protein (TIGR00271 family)
MTNTPLQNFTPKGIVASIRHLFNLRADTDEQGTIDNIRDHVDFKSANAWTLVFAIFIASVGLNTNSSAVIIGAMLISPLMGPIIGGGLGLGINDYKLVRRSLRNLLFAVVISILASTLYFLISPLSEVQSELLARTKPTFFDVLIAIFGGAAGIIALSRHEKGNAIPGVAIATALMPPLCTAGFGLANWELKYFFGALYLFIINSVFISITTFFFVRYLKFPKVSHQSDNKERRLERLILAVAFVVVVPSLVLAWLLQQEISFKSRANSFIQKEVKFERSFVVGKEIDYNWTKPRIEVRLLGDPLTEEQTNALRKRMGVYGLSAKNLEIKQSSLAENLEKKIDEKFTMQADISRQQDIKLAHAELVLKRYEAAENLSAKISSELLPLFPDVEAVKVTELAATADAANIGSGNKSVLVRWKQQPARQVKESVSEFLRRRIDGNLTEIKHVLGF